MLHELLRNVVEFQLRILHENGWVLADLNPVVSDKVLSFALITRLHLPAGLDEGEQVQEL